MMTKRKISETSYQCNVNSCGICSKLEHCLDSTNNSKEKVMMICFKMRFLYLCVLINLITISTESLLEHEEVLEQIPPGKSFQKSH